MRKLQRWWSIVVLTLVATAGCTSVSVRPVDTDAHKILHVCIERNPKVRVGDFVDVLRAGLQRHAISSEVISQDAKHPQCEYVMRYSALQSWDFTPYLSVADIWLDHRGKQIGHANYRLKGKGGLSLTKWKGTAEKMDPVIDELFGEGQ